MASKTETVSDNDLIAEFMEIPKLEDYKGIMWDFQKTGKQIYSIRSEELGYMRSWDWLMPVVIKCKPLAKGKTLDRLPSIYNDILNALTDCNINLVHRHVVEFIKQFNSNLLSNNTK